MNNNLSRTLFLLIALAAGIFIGRYTNKAETKKTSNTGNDSPSEMNEEKQTKVDMANTLLIDTAIVEAANWRVVANAELDPQNYVSAFLIPMLDFTQILSENAVNIRAYLGKSSSGEIKLLLVGVDSAGSDLIDYGNGEYVFDFTTPCPAMCDPGSALN